MIDLGDVGQVLTCGTDQVRFHRGNSAGPAPLAEVSALVLSEAMRDVGLAVGVASIAADPEWADRLSLDGRFLKVRGDLRTYRIHLGSANILTEPDDPYLCVVVSGKKGPDVFLPFEEGGGRLSVILSKAFLLAKDTAITDPGITMQIRRGLGG